MAVSHAASAPVGRYRDDRRRSDRVDFMAVEVPLPGEHGYRYFPAYYRHLFDTMRRTPILDSNGDETAECTFDQLVTPPSVNLSLEKHKNPLPIELTGETSRSTPQTLLLPRPLPERRGARYAGYTDDPDAADEATADFYLLALPFEQAGRIARAFDSLHPNVFDGDWARLVAFDQHCIPRDDDGHDLVQCVPKNRVNGTKRGKTGKPNHPNYPLRDLSGLQFFFPNNVQIGRGHVIHGDSEWGLTSIAQATHWRARLSRREGYLGQLSIDIGNFYREHIISSAGATTPNSYLGLPAVVDALSSAKTAWQSPSWEIPLRVWDQILESDERAVDPPIYYHMDDGILMHRVEGADKDPCFYPAENRKEWIG